MLVRAQVTIADCVFSDLYGEESASFIKAVDAGNAIVRATTFMGKDKPLHTALNSVIYSDDLGITIVTADGFAGQPQPLSGVPELMGGMRFLQGNDSWFVNVQWVRAAAAAAA